MNANLRNFALWVIIVLLLLALFTLFQNPGQRTSSQDISFSDLLTAKEKGAYINAYSDDGLVTQTYAY